MYAPTASYSLWRTDTIVVSKLNKPSFSIKPPPPHFPFAEIVVPSTALLYSACFQEQLVVSNGKRSAASKV